jgi:probable HAF family extracellular repeat protein
MLLFAGLIAALILAGCGGGGGGGDEASSTTTSETTAEAPAPAPATKGRWVITDLGTLGGPESGAVAMNDRGQIVGWADTRLKDTDGNFRWSSFLWESGEMQAINISAADINDRGQVAGSVTVEKHDRAALWQNGKTRILGTLSGERNWWTEAIAINDRGQVVGNDIAHAQGGNTVWRGFLWDAGPMIDLGTLGARTTRVAALTNRGQVVGVSNALAGGLEQTHAFLWENGKMRDLGPRFRLADPAVITERGQIPGRAYGRAAVWERGVVRYLARSPLARGIVAHDINKLGTVVGACIVPPRPQNRLHPCLWRDGTVRDLGIVFGDRGYALALNDGGQVIGNSYLGNRKVRAFVWEHGKITDLGTLPGGAQSGAFEINNRGEILGWSQTKTGAEHAVLWTLNR